MYKPGRAFPYTATLRHATSLYMNMNILVADNVTVQYYSASHSATCLGTVWRSRRGATEVLEEEPKQRPQSNNGGEAVASNQWRQEMSRIIVKPNER